MGQNTRRPTSKGSKCTVKPFCSQVAASSEYFDFFRSCARCDRSSNGTVSSNRTTVVFECEKITTSGRSDVEAVSTGNRNGSGPRSYINSQSSACSKIACEERGRRKGKLEFVLWQKVPSSPVTRNRFNKTFRQICLRLHQL